MTKSNLRNEARQARKLFVENLSDKDIQSCAKHFSDQFQCLPFYPDICGRQFAAYWPRPPEADCRQIMDAMQARGAHLNLPIVENTEVIKFYPYKIGEPLKVNSFGIEEPIVKECEILPDILLVPLVGFDSFGHRLGYGMGHYDRALKKLRSKKTVVAVGVAYDCQEVEKIPVHDGDQQLDWILTEKQLIQVKT